jgi:hypothetical protein
VAKKIYVLMENDFPVGVTSSKTRAESWIFSMNHDYYGPFVLEEAENVPPRAPVEEHGATPAQNLLRNLEKVEQGLTQSDETLKKQVEQLEKTLKKKFKSSLLKRGLTREQRFLRSLRDPATGTDISTEAPRGKPFDEQFDEALLQDVKERLDEGWDVKDIVRDLEISSSHVYKIRKYIERERGKEEQHAYPREYSE